MRILGLNKTTLLDYPSQVAACIFTGGCNFRCPFCHNSDIVLMDNDTHTYEEDEIIDFLIMRKKVLTGVCISGGEPTLNLDLPYFIERIKGIGYRVKLDTNGTNPGMLEALINNGLIDYCAMDIKNSPEKYPATAGNEYIDVSHISRSVELLKASPIDYEFRTTVVGEFHDKSDMEAIGKWIEGAKAYYIQSYTHSDKVLQKGLHAHSLQTLEAFVKICQKYVPNSALRGV